MLIAIIEDDRVTNEYLKVLIENEGWKVNIFFSGEDFFKAAEKNNYSCLVLDINLKLMSGFDVLYFLKKSPEKYGNPKCLILSAKKNQEDVNRGLREGADDFIKKPFNDEEFILRLNSLLLRENRICNNRITYKGSIFDFDKGEVTYSSEKIKLSKHDIKILKYFFLNKGIVISRNKFYNLMWQEEYRKGDKKMEASISRLKKKVPMLTGNIVSHRGLGYKLLE